MEGSMSLLGQYYDRENSFKSVGDKFGLKEFIRFYLDDENKNIKFQNFRVYQDLFRFINNYNKG